LIDDVQYYVLELANRTAANVSNETTSFKFDASTPTFEFNEDYGFRVAIVTNDIVNPFSDFMNFSTTVTIPNLPPVNLTAREISPDSITFSWEKPPLLDYFSDVMISYEINITYPNGSFYQLSTDHTYTNISDLSPYSQYNISVAIVNEAGMGPTSYIDIMTLEKAPSAPPNITSISTESISSVFVEWIPPPVETHNGIIRYYLVFLYSSCQDDDRTLNVTTNQVIISSLNVSCNYSVAVAAFTVDVGPMSSPRTIVLSGVMFVICDFVLELSVTNITATSVSLAWDSPFISVLPAETISHYTVYVYSGRRSPLQSFRTNNNSLTVEDLQPNTLYLIRVTGSDATSEGPDTIIEITTNETAPDGVPTNVTAIPLTSTSILLTWSPPLMIEQNGLIRNYKVSVSNNDKGTLIMEETSQLSIQVDDLDIFTLYYCSISAVTIQEGEYTEPISVTTKEAAPNGPPLNITIDEIEATSIVLLWQPPNDTTGIIRSYVVMYNEDSITTMHPNITLTSLGSFTSYNVSIAAVTIQQGPFSDHLYIKTLSDFPSSSPREFRAMSIDPVTLILQWEPLTLTEASGVIQLYNITLHEMETDSLMYHTTTNSSITITDLHPFYTYVCTVSAVNDIGQGPPSRVTIQMSERAPTSPPGNLSINPLSSTMLNVSWGDIPFSHRNGLIRHYILQIIHVNSQLMFNRLSMTTHVIIDNLQPNSIYNISVAGLTVNIGPHSDHMTLSTLEDAPSGSPIQLNTLIHSSSLATLQWSSLPDEVQNGIIIGYNITLISNNGSFTFNTSDTKLTLELKPFTNYSYIVAAFTNEGLGPYSDISSFSMPEGSPSSSPTSVQVIDISSTGFTIRWAPPLSEHHHGIIRGYQVIVIDNTTGMEAYNEVVTNTTLTVQNLRPFNNYTYTVSAVTVSAGVFSQPSSVMTNESAPSGPPLNLNITVSQFEANVTWEPPAIDSHNGIIRFYKVHYYSIQDGREANITTIQPRISLTDLRPFYEYVISVLAVTIENGPNVSATFRTLESRPSGPPLSVRLFKLNFTSIELTWSHPERMNRNGIIKSYIVQLSSTNGGIRNFSIENNDTLRITLTDLDTNTNYTIRVAAVTIAIGTYSEPIEFDLVEQAPSEPPSNFNVNYNDEDGILHLSWDELAQVNGTLLGYVVTCTSVDADNEILSANVTMKTNVNLTNVETDTYYNCTVCGYTSAGCGPHAMKTISTHDNMTIGVLNVNVTSVTTSSIEIKWRVASDIPESLIYNYTLSYQLLSSPYATVATPSNELTLRGLMGNSHTIAPLLSSSKYRIIIHGIGSDGVIVAVSLPLNVTLNNLSPEEGLNCFSSNSTSVTCTSSKSYGTCRPYIEIDLFDNYFPEFGNFKRSFQFENTITFNDLRPYASYMINVGCNDDSQNHSTTLITTLPTVPSAHVLNVSATVLSSTAVNISWFPPSKIYWNGIIQEYSISFTAADSSMLDFSIEVPPSINDGDPKRATVPLMSEGLIVDKLEAGMRYNISIIIRNNAGNGTESPTEQIRTIQSVPTGPPTNVTLTSNGSMFQLNWSPPQLTDRNGDIINYLMVVVFPKTSNVTTYNQTSNDTSINLSGLDPYELIYISTAAETSAGVGPISSFAFRAPEGCQLS
jgi:receptor-type tyrosine-protein phosphatase Q